MTITKHASLIALAALILCSACTDKSATATFITPTSQQVTAIKWDETISATTTASVGNTALIFMR